MSTGCMESHTIQNRLKCRWKNRNLFIGGFIRVTVITVTISGGKYLRINIKTVYAEWVRSLVLILCKLFFFTRIFFGLAVYQRPVMLRWVKYRLLIMIVVYIHFRNFLYGKSYRSCKRFRFRLGFTVSASRNQRPVMLKSVI